MNKSCKQYIVQGIWKNHTHEKDDKNEGKTDEID